VGWDDTKASEATVRTSADNSVFELEVLSNFQLMALLLLFCSSSLARVVVELLVLEYSS
jgi:hypothetical protein